MKIEDLYDQLEHKKKKICIVGLGYVGLPLLAAFSNHFDIIGFDVDEHKVRSLNKDPGSYSELIGRKLSKTDCKITSNVNILKEANFLIIAVPTPVDDYKNPDLGFIKEASRLVGQNMSRDTVIVYESTVYPGVTEEVCIPILEKESKLICRKDFHVGYSPERINPGDSKHTLENILKIVSAQDENILEIISKVYRKIIKAGVYKAKSIKIAEAAKVIENTQRDINIALINELAILFSKLGLDTMDVLEAARTKWNFLDFKPGLVGGHCIGVDPYYLTYKAKEINYYPEVINAGRRINDMMGKFIGEQILKNLLNNNSKTGSLKVVLFGIAFKENVSDFRNTRIIDIYNYLQENNISVSIHDPIVSKEEIKRTYGIELIEFNEISDTDALVFCVAHDCFKKIDLDDLKSRIKTKNPIIFDIKSIFDRGSIEKKGFRYWRL
jgi:UDP-N-acetyl-D-glucosamine/UDP-N-acetyl-D-galactosamine dehydrogenase